MSCMDQLTRLVPRLKRLRRLEIYDDYGLSNYRALCDFVDEIELEAEKRAVGVDFGDSDTSDACG